MAIQSLFVLAKTQALPALSGLPVYVASTQFGSIPFHFSCILDLTGDPRHSSVRYLTAGAELVVLVFEQDVERGE